MRNVLLLSCAIVGLWSAGACAQRYHFAPAYIDPDPEQSARDWLNTMLPNLPPEVRAACPESADAQAEQACVLEFLERRADSGPAPRDGPRPQPAAAPALPTYDVLHACLRRPGMEPGGIARCVEEERGAAKYLRGALGRLPPDARARCVGAVSPADRRVLEAAAGYYQALTVYCGAILVKADD